MSNDLINREDLIKALQDKDLITWTHEYGDAIPVDWLMSVINNIDGISRHQGKWIEDNGILACTNCQTIWINRKPTDYCPNCGADMRGNNNE